MTFFISQNMEEIPDNIWWMMCAAHMSLPIPLKEMDLTKPFVYDRKLGFFYVPSGYHIMAMATLYAIRKGLDSVGDIEDNSDKWLGMGGSCFKSSVHDNLLIGFRGSLSAEESLIFKRLSFSYIFEE